MTREEFEKLPKGSRVCVSFSFGPTQGIVIQNSYSEAQVKIENNLSYWIEYEFIHLSECDFLQCKAQKIKDEIKNLNDKLEPIERRIRELNLTLPPQR